MRKRLELSSSWGSELCALRQGRLSGKAISLYSKEKEGGALANLPGDIHKDSFHLLLLAPARALAFLRPTVFPRKRVICCNNKVVPLQVSSGYAPAVPIVQVR